MPCPGSDLNMNHLSALSLRPPSVPDDPTRAGAQQQQHAAALSSSSDSSDNPADSNPVSSTSLGISSPAAGYSGHFAGGARGLTPINLSAMGYNQSAIVAGNSPTAPAAGPVFAVPMQGFAQIVHPSCPLHGHMTSPRKVDPCTTPGSAGLRLAPIPLSSPIPSHATLHTFGQSSPINTYGTSYGTTYGPAAADVEALVSGPLPTYGATASGLAAAAAAAAAAHTYADPRVTSVGLNSAAAAASAQTLGRRSPARLATLSTTLAGGVGSPKPVAGIESVVRFGQPFATNGGGAMGTIGRPVSPAPVRAPAAASGATGANVSGTKS